MSGFVEGNYKLTLTSKADSVIKSISDLEHLAGKEVCILADGYVLSSPLDPQYIKAKAVSKVNADGTLEIPDFEHQDEKYKRITVGLPYVFSMSDLPIEDVDNRGDSVEYHNLRYGLPNAPKACAVRVVDSAGLYSGIKGEDDSNELTDFKNFVPINNERKISDGYAATKLRTEKQETVNISGWRKESKMVLKKTNPLPVKVTGYVLGYD